ncbi:MAG: sulfite exporter TauE/SafE family protein [Streptosporangiaceae bacterium]
MLGTGWTEAVALAAAFLIAVLATPAGISGAVLLLPFQVSVLGTPSPSVTPTNLLYNVVATPGALYRYWRQGQAVGPLAGLLIAGTLPGVVAGSIIRVEVLPSPRVFDLVVAAVLLPLGVWLALTRPPGAVAGAVAGTDEGTPPVRPPRHPPVIPRPVLVLLAAAVGCVGGIYGIGGGSILAPVLTGTGRPPSEVAPAALASTFVTSVAGVVTFTLLSLHGHGPVAPDWPTGIALGLGGLAGAYLGARIQPRLPDRLIRRLIGILVAAIAGRYLWSGLGPWFG